MQAMARSTRKSPARSRGARASTNRAATLARGHFLLGAAIGTGMTAKSAARGGADFLLALSAGRFRSMGAPSAACMLALRDSNQLVMEFGCSEVVGATALPVFFGATTLGYRDRIEDLVARIAEAGFHGVTNFPSCVFLDGQFRQFLEERGIGLDAEIELLRIANRRGLMTLGYVHTVAEAQRMAASGVDLINLDFGWNTGGILGVDSSLNLDDAAGAATLLVNAVHAIAPRTRCLIEGGPIVMPEQMDEVCRRANADGYIGGSTIDRLPLESAIEMATAAFKAIGGLRREVVSLRRELAGKAPIDALTGFNERMIRARDRVVVATDSDLPVLIVGEAGSGRSDVGKFIHDSGARRGRKPIVVTCGSGTPEQIELNFFGCAAGAFQGVEKARVGWLELARGSTLVLCDVEKLPLVNQRQLLQAVDAGTFWRRGGTDMIELDVRFVGVSSVDPTSTEQAARFDAAFCNWLDVVRISLPPLREHLEDLPLLAQQILRNQSTHSKARLDPSTFRVLVNHSWPGNLRELRAVLLRSTLAAGNDIVYARDLPSFAKEGETVATGRAAFPSERDWILDALKRHRYRRSETAQFLGLSRKTLYNKICAYELYPEGAKSDRS